MNEPKETPAVEERNGLVLDEDESHELREVFSVIFPQYLAPLEELIAQLLDGKADATVIEGLRGTVTPLTAAAERIGVARLSTVLAEFQAVVERVSRQGTLDEAMRNEVIDVFYRLKETGQNLSGAAFAPVEQHVPGDFVRRISAVDGIGPAELQRVLAAGLTTAEQIAAAAIHEIAAVTGLDEALARRVHAAFGGSTPAPPWAPDAPQPSSRLDGDPGATLRDAGFVLLGLVRERVRLVSELQLARAMLQRLSSEADEVSRESAALARELDSQRRELSQQKEALARREADLVELNQAIEAARALPAGVATAGGEPPLSELKDRLAELQERVDQCCRASERRSVK